MGLRIRRLGPFTGRRRVSAVATGSKTPAARLSRAGAQEPAEVIPGRRAHAQAAMAGAALPRAAVLPAGVAARAGPARRR